MAPAVFNAGAPHGKILCAFRVLDSHCPTPRDRKERMKIFARLEGRCGIRAAGSLMAHRVNRAAIAENVATSRKAFRAGKKAFGFRLISPCLGLFRLISPFCGAANPLKDVTRSGNRLKPELRTNPKAAWKLRKADVSDVFAAGEVNSSAFARDCPPLPAIARLFWGRDVFKPPGSERPSTRSKWSAPALFGVVPERTAKRLANIRAAQMLASHLAFGKRLTANFRHAVTKN